MPIARRPALLAACATSLALLVASPAQAVTVTYRAKSCAQNAAGTITLRVPDAVAQVGEVWWIRAYSNANPGANQW